jgi:hypothetical protein
VWVHRRRARVDLRQSLARSFPLLPRGPITEGTEDIVDSRSEDQAAAFERFDSAKRERDARVGDHEVARGSNRELPALAELLAAEDRLAAREAWCKWTERND